MVRPGHYVYTWIHVPYISTFSYIGVILNNIEPQCHEINKSLVDDIHTLLINGGQSALPHSQSSSMMAILAVLMPMLIRVTAGPEPETEVTTSNSSAPSLMASLMISTLRSYWVVLDGMTTSRVKTAKSRTSVHIRRRRRRRVEERGEEGRGTDHEMAYDTFGVYVCTCVSMSVHHTCTHCCRVHTLQHCNAPHPHL